MTTQFHLSGRTGAGPALAPGALIEVRSAVWRVRRVDPDKVGDQFVHCLGVSGITRGKEAIFIARLEPDLKVLDPVEVELVPDRSPGFEDTKLFLEAAFRATPPVGVRPLTLGRAAIDDLAFQHEPVERALAQPRVRLLLADDVGLGKTLEAGLIAAELILRRRAARILVVTTRAMLVQFQKEFWTRFAIPLARLDSAAIRRMRNEIPENHNVFDQFERAIVSIDTLKKDLQYRQALEQSRWDLVIIDEAHNAARRAHRSGTSGGGGSESLRARLARLLSRRADSLLLLTATPHDGSADSFASLVEMLDPTRVPNPAELKREDIEDLVIRRFRTSPEVVAAFKEKVPPRQLFRHEFPLAPAEEAAYDFIANLRLDLDEPEGGGRRRGLDLFRTTLAKAIFSSPAACLETIEGRLKRIAAGQAKGSAADTATLTELGDLLRAIGPGDFTKYRELLALLDRIGWTGRKRRDRLVIFSERIRTLEWLQARLHADLGLDKDAIRRIDGGSVEADEQTQQVLEDFGQETAPIRILLASDMASEGLNLHYQCHRLIHFDLPWSLLRFQQRNGRIDRYGQDRAPEIHYFVGESSHPKVRDMWVLDKLVAKDEAAQQGVGDPAVFLGTGDAEDEEEVVAEAVAEGIGAEAFDREMNARAAAADEKAGSDAGWDMLFGDYHGAADGGAAEDGAAAAPAVSDTTASAPPRLYPDTFAYAEAMLHRLAGDSDPVLTEQPKVRPEDRVIEFTLPDDMKARDSFGYARKEDVDDRYMPVEAVGKGGRIALTDRLDVVNTAVAQARGDDRAWPDKQYLWDVHPMLDWLNDRAATFFGRRAVPLCRLPGRLAPGETAVLLHGTVPNRVGTPVVDAWGVVRVAADGRAGPVEPVPDFLLAVGLTGQLPNAGDAAAGDLRPALARAVDAFQAHLVARRSDRTAALEQVLDEALDRLSAFQSRFNRQLELDFPGIDETGAPPQSLQERRRRKRRDDRRRDVDRMFDDWTRWFTETCELAEDPNPFVDIKAVFLGAPAGGGQ